jgi:hypothetical protein
VGITVLLVETAALLYDFGDLLAARLDGLFVGCQGIDTGYRAFGSVCSCTLGIEVVGKNGKDLSGVFRGELGPKVVDAALRRMLANRQLRSWRHDRIVRLRVVALVHAGCSGEWTRLRFAYVDEVVRTLGVHGHSWVYAKDFWGCLSCWGRTAAIGGSEVGYM